MNKVMAGWAAALTAAGLALPAPAFADFAISKKPKASAPAQQRPARAPRRPRPAAQEATPTPAAPKILGIDPALLQEILVAGKYKVDVARDAEAKTAVLHVTNGKTGWSVTFSDCAEENRCSKMEFYTLWRTPNEANVCRVWGNDVTQDPTRNLGKPYCYTVAGLDRQFHLKLSSDQAPYAGMNLLNAEEARERMNSMIGVWTYHLGILPRAWTIASSKCPRASDRCALPAPKPTPPPAASSY